MPFLSLKKLQEMRDGAFDRTLAVLALTGGLTGAGLLVFSFYPDITGTVFFAIVFGAAGFALGAAIGAALAVLLQSVEYVILWIVGVSLLLVVLGFLSPS